MWDPFSGFYVLTKPKYNKPDGFVFIGFLNGTAPDMRDDFPAICK